MRQLFLWRIWRHLNLKMDNKTRCMNFKRAIFFTWVFLVVVRFSYGQTNSSIKKLKDMVIYEDSLFYNAFPSIVKTKKGFLLSFRQAPDRRQLGAANNYHVDHNSYLVSLTSKDGENWSKAPNLIYAHPFGGSQDPCLLQMKDGTLLCTSYGGTTVGKGIVNTLEKPLFETTGFVFLGGYVMRSTDHGKSWGRPYYPPYVGDER